MAARSNRAAENGTETRQKTIERASAFYTGLGKRTVPPWRGKSIYPLRSEAADQSVSEHGEQRCQTSSSLVVGQRESLLRCAPRS